MAFAISSPTSANGRRNRHFLLCLFARVIALVAAPVAHAHPFHHPSLAVFEQDDDLPKDPADASLWAYLGTAVALVLLGGAFAGLTIALMGQDEIYLQVIATSGEGSERKNAKKVLQLLKKGKHWVLVTLLLSNVITNETLPIVLDRSLGGGWPAVLSSTVLIVIFGEIVPQSICVRYGLPIGAWMSPVVLGLMYLMAPVAWPTAKLLDRLLGEDHGQTYKKAGLKTLVRLHKTLGPSADEMLNEDEVTIITAVLDLKAKAVGTIMTPMKDVFTMSADTVLDEQMMEKILSAGYSRIPIYAPDNKSNFVGMLLVKMLITYDPEDALRVRDFALATLPETRPETSCLDIVNFFQEGKSHMVLVSDYPGESRGSLGVVTLEDVIEELIGEEIIDESDVFVDVHKAIRRMTPAPRTKVPKGEIVTDHRPSKDSIDTGARTDLLGSDAVQPRRASAELASSPRLSTTFLMRRRSSGNGSVSKADDRLTLRSDDPEIIQHLKHLGPSNAANRPKSTRINTVKIKPGIPNTIPEHTSSEIRPITPAGAPKGGIGEGLLESAGREASDGVHSLAVGYGTMSTSANQNSGQGIDFPQLSPKSKASDDQIVIEQRPSPRKRAKSQSTIGSLHSIRSASPSPGKTVRRHTARSGSISENIVDLNGVKKIVLETTSSSDSEDKNHEHDTNEQQDRKDSVETDTSRSEGAKAGKKKRKKRAGRNKKKGGGSGETAPLLGGEEGR